MARHFVGSTSEYLRTYKLGLTTYPFTIAAWFYMTTLSGTNRLVIGLFRTDSTADQFVIRVNFATSQLQFRADAGGASNATISSMAAGQWYHVVARGFSATDRRVRVNNGTDATDTVSKSPAGLGQILLGPSWDAGTFATSPTMVGREQEAAIWNATLDDQEIAALYGSGAGTGLSPARIRPGNLVHYWPLEGRHSLEPDYGLTRAHLQVVGTQPFPHQSVKLAPGKTSLVV